MTDYILWSVSGIFAGVIIHAISIISLPHLLPEEIWDSAGSLARPNSFVVLDSENSADKFLPTLDPAMEHALCRFSLAEAPRLIRGPMNGFYWSMAIFNTSSEVIYSTNNRLMKTGTVELILATPQQVPEIESISIEGTANLQVIEVPNEELFVLFRAFRPDSTMKEEIQGLLSGLSCESFAIKS